MPMAVKIRVYRWRYIYCTKFVQALTNDLEEGGPFYIGGYLVRLSETNIRQNLEDGVRILFLIPELTFFEQLELAECP